MVVGKSPSSVDLGWGWRGGWVSRTFKRSRSAYRPKHPVIKVLPSVPVPSSPLKQGEEVLLRKKKRCRVLFSYQPVHDDELELKVDQNLDFMCEVEDGWWKGRLGGRVGVFPSNFVEMCEDEATDPIKARAETIEELPLSTKTLEQMPTSLEERSVAAVVEAKNKKNSLGANRFIKEEADLASKGLPKVEKEKTETEKTAPSKVMTTSERLLVGGSKTPPDTAPRLPPKPVKEQCLVLFPYTAQNEDELTLEEGQTIQIISREVEDKGWWKGEIDGRTGVFPDNFVKLIVEEDKRERKPSRPPPVAREVEKSLLGKPLANSVKRLSDDIKAALSSENLSRSPGSSEKLRGSEEKLVSRFDGRGSEKRKSRRSGEESGSGDRLISGSNSRKNSSNTKTSSSIGTPSSIKTPSSIGLSSKMLQGSSAASSPPKSSSALTNSSKSSAAPAGLSITQKKDASETSRLEVRAQRLEVGDSDAKERRLSEPPTKRLDTPGHEATGFVDLSQSAPLSHPTAGRVKAPKRRPPSQHFLKENIPDVETMEASLPDSTETPDLASKSKSSPVDGVVASQKSREGESLKAKLPVTASQVLPSAQDSSPASEAKPSWLEELSRKQANRRSGVFPEKQPPPVKPAEQEQAFRRSGGSVQEEASRRSLVGGGEKPVASKPEPPLAENKPNLPSRPSQVKAEEGNRKSLSSSLASSASSIINSKKTSGREQENTKPTDLAKSDKAPQRPTLPAPLSKTPSAPSIPSPSASVGAKKELGRRESESEEKKRRAVARGATLSCRETRRTLRAAKPPQLRACTAQTSGNLPPTSVLWRGRRSRLWRSLLRRRGGGARKRRRKQLREELEELLVVEVTLGGLPRFCEGGRVAPRGLKVQIP